MNDDPLTVHLRWMIRRDMPDVMRIEQASFDGGWSEDAFLRYLRHRDCIGMVAEWKREDVYGYFVYVLREGYLEVVNFAVDPAHCRRKVGTQMIDKLKKKIAHNYPRRDRVTAAVREQNLPFQLFLRANGFEAVGVKRNYFDDTGESAFLFEWRYRRETETRPCVGDEILIEEEGDG